MFRNQLHLGAACGFSHFENVHRACMSATTVMHDAVCSVHCARRAA